MKKIFAKRIISLLTVICIMISLMPFYETSVLAYNIYLDQEDWTSTTYSNSYYFTPEESGFYSLKMWSPHGVDNGYCDVFDSDDMHVEYIYSRMNEEEDYESMPPETRCFYLEKGERYTFSIAAGMSMWGENGETTYFLLTKAAINDLGEYEIGDSVSTDIYADILTVLRYTAKETREVLFSTESGSMSVYDRGNSFICGNGSEVAFDAIEGNEYYIVLMSGDYWGDYSTTFTSEYVEKVDNSTVYTENVEEMQTTHPYLNGLDKYWVYTAPEGTIYNEFTFDNSSELTYYDYLYVYDENGKQIASYNYWQSFKGKTILVPGRSFSIRLVTDKTNNAYGFKLSNVVSANSVPAPEASVQSGKIRPANVSLSANSLSTIYYKVSTAGNQGSFEKYTSAINITEDAVLQAYAQIGDYRSEIVTYNYTIDNSSVAAPVFSVKASTESSLTLAINAEEGDVYYKIMSQSSYYQKMPSTNTITLYSSGVIAAYAQSGILKSDVVYYSYTIKDDDYYELSDPIITETPIMGGKRVTISVPDDFKFENRDIRINYVESHDSYMCNDDYYRHDLYGEWSREYALTEINIFAGDADGGTCYIENDFPRSYDVYKNSSFSVYAYKEIQSDSGYWEKWYMDTDMSWHEPMSYNGGFYEWYYSPTVIKFVEVPKAEKPEFSIIGGKLYITAGEGQEICFKVNDGPEIDYTGPVDVAGGDVVHARAYGLGVSESDTAEYTVILDDIMLESKAVLGGFEISIASGDANAEIYYSLDNADYQLYNEKIFIKKDTTVSAYAMINGEMSETKSLSVTVAKSGKPVASHESGTYPAKTNLSFSCSGGEQIFYVLEGAEYEYTGDIALLDDMNISVYSVGIGMSKSEVTDYSYYILRASAPEFEETDILGGKSVSIKTETEGASIYYKIGDGEYKLYTQPLEFFDLAKICAYTAIEGATDSAVKEHNVTMVQTHDPVPDYASGEVFKGTVINLNSHNDGAETVIYYTTDNTEPTMQSLVYDGGIEINEPVKIKAVAYAVGRAKSEVVTLNYTLRKVKDPEVKEQNVKGGKKIYLSSLTENALIYYTSDGTDPKTSATSVLYEAPFVVSKSGTKICAYAVLDRYLDSDVSEHTVDIGQLPAPVFSVNEENVYLNTSVTITADPISDVYYTLDGTVPTKESLLYTEPVVVSEDVTIKAIAFCEGWQDSNIVEKTYKIYKTENPYIVKKKNGDYMKIELKSETPDATIYYTLDGTGPCNTSEVYKDAILLSEDTTVKMFAASEGRKPSEIYTETVLVRHSADPASSVASGEVKKTDQIILTASENAVIYYTLDGSEPTEESNVYTSPIVLQENTVLKAFASEKDMLDSNVVVYEYTIKRAKTPEILFDKDVLGGKTVKIETPDNDVVIYYTLDGSEPTVRSQAYDIPFTITKTTKVRALAVEEGAENSDIAYREMVVPVAEIWNSGTSWCYKGEVVNEEISPHTVYYTLDGKTPTMASEIYEPGTISINEDTVMRAFAIGVGYAKSAEVKLYFYIDSVYVSLNAKANEGKATVAITCSPGDATMYYTLDGSSPELAENPARKLYTGSFTITENATIKVYAESDKYNPTLIEKKVYVNKAKNPFIVANSKLYYYSSYTGKTFVPQGETVELKSHEGMKIKYTLDGSEPTEENGIDYTEPFVVNDKMQIKAYCYGENHEDSDIVTFGVDILNIFGDVTERNVLGGKGIDILPKVGLSVGDSRRFTDEIADYTIYYTTDGTEPTEESPVYKKVVNGETVIEAPENWTETKTVNVKTLAVADKCISGKPVSETITVKKLDRASFIPADTSVYKNTYITLETAEPNAHIYYTLDGSEPTYESDKYEAPFIIEDDATVKMFVAKKGMANSDVVSVSYNIKRVETPTYTKLETASGMLITLDCETENAKIYYTLNGDEPTDKSMLYTKPFKLKKNAVLSFVAISENMKPSYTVSELIDVPTANMSIIGITDSEAAPGEYVDAFLYFQNNKDGVAAYAISVEYDSSVLTPVSAESLLGGIFTSNLNKGAAAGAEKAVSIVWINDKSIYDSGNAAKITFKVNQNAEGQKTPLYIKENGVINHLYNMVDVAYMDGSVNISGDAQNPEEIRLLEINDKKTEYTDTKLSMTTQTDGNNLTVKVKVDENSGIGAYNISMLYDNTALSPISVSNGELFASDVISNVNDPGADVSKLSEITVLSYNDKDTVENGVLYTVTFKINSQSASGQMIVFSDVMLLDVSGNEIIGIYEDLTIGEDAKTVTTVESGKINVTPHNVPVGSSIIVACYNKDYLTFSEVFENDNSVISFDVPDVEMDKVRVFVWNNMNDITPISKKVDEVLLN